MKYQTFPILVFFSAILVSALVAQKPENKADKLVLVELFTSEGCSSCPPAEKLLNELGARQPVAGATVVPLAFHVDYWNRLGWTDPFSTKEHTERQRAYSVAFKSNRVYTPQMIVDGSTEFVGSNTRKAHVAIQSAAAKQKIDIDIDATPSSQNAVTLSITLGELSNTESSLDVIAAVTENGLESDVSRGENEGRKLVHDGVVRAFAKIGEVRPETETNTVQIPLTFADDWNRNHLSAVVFLQDPQTMKIHGVGATKLKLPQQEEE